MKLKNQELPNILNGGDVGILPTDTLYGLVCRAVDEAAVKRLYSLKNRENKPGTIIAANPEQLVDLGLPQDRVKAAAQYWPNPVSVIIPTEKLGYLHQGKSSLACRVVAGPQELIDLLKKVGPLLTSSANHPGEPPATTIGRAKNYFGDSVDFYVDGGDRSSAEPSTVLRIKDKDDDTITIVRQGAYRLKKS